MLSTQKSKISKTVEPPIHTPQHLDPNRLLRLKEVLLLIPVRRSTWWKWVKESRAPAPVRLGRTTCWRYSDLMEMIGKDAA